jgi:hypothetical protein
MRYWYYPLLSIMMNSALKALKALKVHKACKVNEAYIAGVQLHYCEYGSTYKDAE